MCLWAIEPLLSWYLYDVQDTGLGWLLPQLLTRIRQHRGQQTLRVSHTVPMSKLYQGQSCVDK